jgi:5-methylcytosine-specific restriction endonuclease McrA
LTLAKKERAAEAKELRGFQVRAKAQAEFQANRLRLQKSIGPCEEVLTRVTSLRRARWAKVKRESDHNSVRRARLRGAMVESFSRTEIYDRDGGLCHICGDPVPRDDFHLDHIVPLAKGGEHRRSNVATAHSICNLRKRDKLSPPDRRERL